MEFHEVASKSVKVFNCNYGVEESKYTFDPNYWYPGSLVGIAIYRNTRAELDIYLLYRYFTFNTYGEICETMLQNILLQADAGVINSEDC